VDSDKLDDLEGRHSELEKDFTEYRILMAEWHTKTRSDIDHIVQECQTRKKDCGGCLAKKIKELTEEIVKLKVLMARHAAWIAIGVIVISVVVSAVVKKLL
jgi:hypothetical protein